MMWGCLQKSVALHTRNDGCKKINKEALLESLETTKNIVREYTQHACIGFLAYSYIKNIIIIIIIIIIISYMDML